MRLPHTLILAGALLVAAPAPGQNNAAAPGNTVATTGVDANAAANTAVPATPTTAAAAPGEQNAALPPSAETTADEGTAAPAPARRGFPWGVLGLLGLIGLFGARKASS